MWDAQIDKIHTEAAELASPLSDIFLTLLHGVFWVFYVQIVFYKTLQYNNNQWEQGHVQV